MKIKRENKIIYQDSKILKFIIESPKYGNKEIIIDTEDWDLVKQYFWHVNYKKKMKSFYVITNIHKPKHVDLHLSRLIMNVSNPKIYVDHINHDTLNYKKKNLRSCTNAENMKNHNIPKNNTSGYKGVIFQERKYKNKIYKYWKAQISINNKSKCIGYYKNKIDAAIAYNNAAIKHYGEFACLNRI